MIGRFAEQHKGVWRNSHNWEKAPSGDGNAAINEDINAIINGDINAYIALY